MKRDLYIDCDGVIYNTVSLAFKEMVKLGVDIKNEDEITNYFKACDWSMLIENGGEINGSREKILSLKRSGIFGNVAIATHHCSFKESQVKNVDFDKNIHGVQVFNIPKKIPKHYAVKANNNILIDDALSKVLGWTLYGGYGVLFKQDVEEIIYPTLEHPYFIINDLSSLSLINQYINEYESELQEIIQEYKNNLVNDDNEKINKKIKVV